MLTEEAKLEQWFVGELIAYEESGKYGTSELKKIKRFGNEVINNIEQYYELLDMARSKNMSVKEILGAVRSIEASLLDEASRGTKLSRKQLLSDVIHHIYAQRTGGDTLKRLSQIERAKARTILREEFGRWGNVPENLYSLFRSWHTKQEKAKLDEARALASMGLPPEAAGQLPTIKAHQTASSSSLISGDIKGATTAKEAVEGMRPQFALQQKETMAALEQSNPIMGKLDQIAGSIYHPGMTAEELAARRAVLTGNPETAKAISSGIEEILSYGKGVVRLAENLPTWAKVGAGLTVLGTVADVSDVKAGLTDKPDETASPRIQRMEKAANALRVQSGVVGLSSLFTGAPGAVMAAVTGIASGIYQDRLNREKEKERQLSKIKSRDYDLGSTTITKPKPRNTTRELNLR